MKTKIHGNSQCLTAEEARVAVKALSPEGTQRAAAAVLCVSERTVNRWCRDGLSDASTILLIRILTANPHLAE